MFLYGESTSRDLGTLLPQEIDLQREEARYVDDAVFVKPEYARRGVAREVMQVLEQTAKQAGIKKLRLSSTLNAVPFYKAMGFHDLESSVYHSPSGVSLDCMLMEKYLL